MSPWQARQTLASTSKTSLAFTVAILRTFGVCSYRKTHSSACLAASHLALMSIGIPSKRWVTHSYGDIGNLKLEESTVPPPAENEVRIRSRAIGLNFADVLATLGLYESAGNPPFCPGFEVSGVVDAIGEGVEGIHVNDRVHAMVQFGTCTTAINVDYRYVRPVPEDWSFQEAAAFATQTFTAWYALCVLGGIPSNGDRPLQLTSERKVVLVHSAAGGVGLNLVEMVKRVGGEIVAVVGSAAKIPTLEAHGVSRERIIVRGLDDKNGFEPKVREILGGAGVDVLVDSLLGDYFQDGYNVLNLGGRYIVMGSASLMPSGTLSVLKGGLANLIKLGFRFLNRPKLDLVSNISQNKTISGFNLFSLFDNHDLLNRGYGEIEAMDLPKPVVGKTYGFENAPDAMRFFQAGQSVGKIVLEVEPEN